MRLRCIKKIGFQSALMHSEPFFPPSTTFISIGKVLTPVAELCKLFVEFLSASHCASLCEALYKQREGLLGGKATQN